MSILCKYLIIILVLFSTAIFGQPQSTNPLFKDSINITLDSSESIFLKNNFLLLAQRYNVDAIKALVIQAKLLPNPNFSFSRGPIIPINDPTSNFPHSDLFNNSENAASISQLILLAGKRNKQIKVAEANVRLAEFQFYDLIRTLKYTLRTDFFNIYYLQQSARVYDKEISSLQQVVNAFNQQAGKGYISEKEVIRVKAQLYTLLSEYNDLTNKINDTESELRLVLQIKNVYLVPVIDNTKIMSLDPSQFSLNALIDTAYRNRTDLQIARANTDISKFNYNYQKALAFPDITASFSYDKQGSYARGFNAAGIGIDLPLFNRNQGNIKSAKLMIEVNAATQKNVEASVEERIYRSLQKAYDNRKLYLSIDPKFVSDFERLLNEVLINYQKRNLGLLDFLDFYDSYKQNILQINSLNFNRVSAFEDLNFYTGANFFN